MPLTLRALSLFRLLKETLGLYARHFFLFLGISAVPNLVLLMLQLGFDEIPVGHLHQPELLGFVTGLSRSFASLFASSIVTAAVTIAISDIYTEQLPDLWDSFGRLYGKAFRILWAAFLVQLFVFVGTIFCIIPGIYVAGRYGLAIPAVVLENLGPKKALDRSDDLTKDSSARIILVFFLTSILTALLVTMLNRGAAYFGWTSTSHHALISKHALNLVTATLGGIVFGPISAIALALEYFDLRVRFEGFDLQQLRALMMAPEGLARKSYVDVNS
jgi:glycerophosphoryl diester phosphodiesterase family protein